MPVLLLAKQAFLCRFDRLKMPGLLWNNPIVLYFSRNKNDVVKIQNQDAPKFH